MAAAWEASPLSQRRQTAIWPWILFGTSYPWFCGGVKLADGSILAIMTEDRADESAMELVAFKLSGF